MKYAKKNIYRNAIHGIKLFGFLVIFIEIITYTFSFLVSGLIKKDIFNIIEGKDVTFGILSLKVLILLNIIIPLTINIVKQINAGLVADLKVRLTQNIKRKLLEDVNRIPIEMKMLLSEGEVISLFRNECEDISNCFLEFYYQLPKIVLSIAILSIMLCINPVFAIASLLPTMTMLVFINLDSRS
ncbi:MAG: hypothetical protein HFI76_08545 [Lachnospiraceae bacterium]|nr:hypothetical protein [Lachnospiraceae bacterium]